MHPDWPLPHVIAHRLGGALAPENTLAGLRIAAALGCRGVEFDVQLSADGVPVVIHDESLARTTTCGGLVADTDAARLRGCDAGSRHHPAFRGEPLPELAAVARLCIELGLAANVELKCEDDRGDLLGAQVAEHVRRLWAGAAQPPLLSSFSRRALAAARATAPELPRALLFESLPPDWRQCLHQLGCVALHCSVDALDTASIALVKDAGFRLAAYTENDPGRARRWLSLGVDSLFTDRPDLLLALERGEAGTPP